MAGSATCSGEGGGSSHQRRYSAKWYYQCIQSRSRLQPARSASRRRGRVLHRRGLCKVGLRRPSHGAEGDRPGRQDAVAAGRDRPTFAGTPSRPARNRRPGTQDRRAPRGSNLEIPIQLKLGAARVYDDVRMAAKTGPDSVLIDGMEGSTGAGPAHRHRGDRRSGHRGDPPGTQGAGRHREDRSGLAGLLGRYPQWRRRGQGARARGGRRGHRHRRARGAQLQQGHPRGGLRGDDRRARRLLLSLPHGPLSGGHRYPGSGPAERASIPTRPRSASTISFTPSPWSARCWRAPAARRTCTRSSRRIWPRSRWRPPQWLRVPLAGTQFTVGHPDMTRY